MQDDDEIPQTVSDELVMAELYISICALTPVCCLSTMKVVGSMGTRQLLIFIDLG